MPEPKNKPTTPGKPLKISFGVNQREVVNKAANTVNETPEQFIKKSVLDAAAELKAGADASGK